MLGSCLPPVMPNMDMVQLVQSICPFAYQHDLMWMVRHCDNEVLPQMQCHGKFVNVLQLYFLVCNDLNLRKYFWLLHMANVDYYRPNGMSIRAQWNFHNRLQSQSLVTTISTLLTMASLSRNAFLHSKKQTNLSLKLNKNETLVLFLFFWEKMICWQREKT